MTEVLGSAVETMTLPTNLDQMENEFADLEFHGQSLPPLLLPTLPDAQRALARVRYFRQQAADVASVFDEEIARLQAELARVTAENQAAVAPWQRREQWYLGALEQFARAQNAADPKVKTIKLPAGELALKAAQPEWNYGDEKLVISILTFCRGELVRVKEEIDKVNLKKAAQLIDGKVYVTDDQGELHELPVTVTERPATFTIKTA